MTTNTAAYRAAVRRLWARRFMTLVAIAGLFALLLVPELKERPLFVGGVMTSALVGLSMNVLVGYAGQISLAQAALYGGGAFFVGNLVTRSGLPWMAALPVAGLLTAALALVIGFPALRVRGLNLAILTLTFQFVMERSIFRSDLLTRGAAGVDIEPPKIGGIELTGTAMLASILAVLILIWMLDRNLTRSRAGRAFLALRQDEQVAASLGIAVARYKLLAFALSGLYAGIAGGLFGTLIGEVTQNNFEFTFSIQFLVFAVLGGLGSRMGTAIGAAFPLVLTDLLSDIGFRGIIIGGLLLVVTLIRYPGGIAEQGRELRAAGTLFLRRGPVWLLAFIGVAFGAIGGTLLTLFVLASVIGLWDWHISEFWVIILFVAALAVIFQFASQWLGRRAFGAAAGHASPTAALEAITAHETAARLAQQPKVDPASLRSSKPRAPHSGPLLVVDDLAIRFGGVRALDGVSLEVRQGELIGIMGPNGSGKTTMLNCISGFLKPNDGTVLFRGENVAKLAPHDRAARGLGRTFQQVGLVKSETVFDNFLIAQHLVCRYGALEGLLRTGAVVSEERRLRTRATAAIELLGLTDVMTERVRALPHGRAKLVELGCALVTSPELLLLDEPAAGVGPQEAETLGETLKRVAVDFGVTILMIEHHVPLMLSTCDYIYVLNFGRLLTHGEPADVARHPDVIAAYLGSSTSEVPLATAGSH